MKNLNIFVMLSVFFSTGWCASSIAIEKHIARQTRQLIATFEDSHEIIGKIDFRVEHASVDSHGVILNLCVNADCRGRGIGAQLLCVALRTMADEGCAYAQLVALPLEHREAHDLSVRTAGLVRFYSRFGGVVDAAVHTVSGVGMRFDLLSVGVRASYAADVARPEPAWRVYESVAKRVTFYNVSCFLGKMKDGEPEVEPSDCSDKGNGVCTFLVKCNDADDLSSIEQCKIYCDVDEKIASDIAREIARIVCCSPEDVAVALRISRIPALNVMGCARMISRRSVSPRAQGCDCGDRKSD